jgi:transposase
VAMASLPLRREEAGVRGRERVPHLHDALLRAGPQGKEGLRQGSQEPRQEHRFDRRDHPRRGHGGVGGHRGGHRRGEAFEAYVERFLAPSLEEGQVVVLDGLGAHRTEKVRELIEGRGADLVFLPPYSPDLNPIEEAFSKVKQLVRRAGARTREALVEAIGRALAAVTPEDAAGWFDHAGYRPQDQPL